MDLLVTFTDSTYELNGIYRDNGTLNGYPSYKHETLEYYIFADADGQYCLNNTTTMIDPCYYYGPQGSAIGTYRVGVFGLGDAGAITVTEYIESSEEVKDLFVTFATAGSPYEGIFRHQGTYNNHDYWKHESAECYILCFGPVGESAPNVYQWLISEKLSTGDEPLYCGNSSAEANTPLSVSTWSSVKGTAYGLPTVTEYVDSSGTITGFEVSGSQITISVDGTYTLTDYQSGYSADPRVFSNGTYYLARFSDNGGWYFGTTYTAAFSDTSSCKTYDPATFDTQYGSPTVANPSDVKNWWDLETFVAQSFSVTPIYGEEGGDGEDGEDGEDGGDGGGGEIMLVVSGLESVLGEGTVNESSGTWMNGEYYLVDKTATGAARVWKHKDYESVIKVAGSPVQYWAICPTNTSTNFEILKPGTLPDSPYDESTLGSLVWSYRGGVAASVSVVAKVVSEDSGDTEGGENTGNIIGYEVDGIGVTAFNGYYGYANDEYNSKPYYTIAASTGGTYYLYYSGDTSGWAIGTTLGGTPLWYQSTVSETPDGGTWTGTASTPPTSITPVYDTTGGGDTGGDDSGGDTPDDPVLPDEDEPEKISAPAVGDKGFKIGDVFFPLCPNPADNHLSRVSATGKNIALDWLSPDTDTTRAVSVTAGAVYQAKTAGWLVASGAGANGGLVLAYGETVDNLMFKTQGWCLYIPRGAYYAVSTEYTSFSWAFFIPCAGATE